MRISLKRHDNNLPPDNHCMQETVQFIRTARHCVAVIGNARPSYHHHPTAASAISATHYAFLRPHASFNSTWKLPRCSNHISPSTAYHSPGTGLESFTHTAIGCFSYESSVLTFVLLTVLQRSASAAFIVSAIPKRPAIVKGQCASLGLSTPPHLAYPRASLLNIPP